MQVELTQARTLTVGSRDTFSLADGHARTEYDSLLQCASQGGRIEAGGRLWDSPVIMEPTGAGLCQVAEFTCRGVIELRQKAGLVIAINRVPLEKYLYGISKYEISPRWAFATLCAHAIAARTYALHKLWNEDKPISNTAHHQVYGGVQGEHPRARIAIDATRGQVLLYGNEVANTLYHACSGGQTTSGADVWGEEYPYLVAHQDRFCESSPYAEWQLELDRTEVARALRNEGIIVADFVDLQILERDESSRVKKVQVESPDEQVVISGQQFRAAIGYERLRSTLFRITTTRDGILFHGKGWGHGVGMAQWGAAQMGAAGYTTEEILNFYYPGTRIARIY